jgi:hypothetical protein
MRRLCLLGVLALAGALAAVQGAAARTTDSFGFTVSKVAQFETTNPQCAVQRGSSQVDGPGLGDIDICITWETFAPGFHAFRGTWRLAGGGGTLTFAVSGSETFAFFPNLHLDQVVTGTVVEATGEYRGARGTIGGGGPIVINPDGSGSPSLAFEVDLDY